MCLDSFMKATNLLILLAVAALFLGCRRETKTTREEERAPSTLTTAIEGFTGKTAIQHGERAKDTLRQAAAAHDAALDEVME